jgi:glycosyltransferase involved in cell wall biosynthesis
LQSNSKIKICIISTIRNAHVIRWSRVLDSKDYDITVISSEPNEWEISDINVIECLPNQSKIYLYHLFQKLIHAIKIHLILKKIKPDIIHIHSLDYIHPFMFFIVNLISRISDNLIISTWGSDIIGNAGSNSKKRGKFAKKLLLRQAKEITATSYYLASETARLTSRKKSIHVIPFGIDCNLFYKVNTKPENEELWIGFVKHLKAKYGPDILLKALANIVSRFPEIRLIMIGHGEMENELKKLASNLGIKEKVQFNGYIQNEKLPLIMKNFDIFVMPSTENSETFGVAAIEAQAMEIPVVASKIGGIPEAMLDGTTGILVEPKNVEQLADAMIRLIENPEDRKRMGKAGRQFVLNNYNLEENVGLFESLYKSMSNI